MNRKMNDQEFDELLRRELLSVNAPAELRQKLLQVEDVQPLARSWFGRALSANDGVLRRALPVAACLVIALGIAFWSVNDPQRDFLEDEIFEHMYLEGQLDNANAAVLPLETVNKRLQQWMGANLEMSEADADLNVTFAKDCWVAKQVAFHMIMKGETGAVTVMMIPDKDPGGDTAREFSISDATWSGVVTRTNAGYLVVVGNKREPLTAYRNLLSGKLEWEY